MTLLFFDGFDNAVTLSRPEYTTSAWGSQTGRTGVANHAVGIPVNSGFRNLTLPSAAATCVLGVALFPTGSTGGFGYTGTGNPIQFQSTSGTTDLSLTFDVAGKPQIRLGTTGTVLATGPNPVASGVWIHVQIKVVLHATAGSCEVRIDGQTVINYTGQTTTTSGPVTAIRFGNPASGTATQFLFFDDLYVCDGVDATATQGRPFNTFLGDLKVATLTPTADSTTVQWTPSTGTNHAATVDEAAPNTTDYVSSSVVGNRDLYDMADLPASTTAVLGVQVGMYAQKSDAGASSVKPVVKDPSGTTVQAAIPLSTTWNVFYGPMITKKANGALPSVADLNATQVGIDTA